MIVVNKKFYIFEQAAFPQLFYLMIVLSDTYYTGNAAFFIVDA